jgi:GT2 family glycosyltransferase
MPSEAVPEAAARVGIVIPNWNGAHLLPACLDSLRQQSFSDFAVIVVDNGSTDGSLDLLRRDYPDVQLVALPENIGFAGGVNAGIRACGGEYVVLLNNDTEAAPDWLEAAVAELDRQPEIGFAASRLIDFRDRRVLDCVADGFSFYGVPYKVGEGEIDAGQYAAPFEILSACAAASFYRRALFDDIGLFDEDFFAYVEDIDIALRAVLAGHRGISIPAARVYHLGTATTGGAPSAFTIHLSARNVWWVLMKCTPATLLPLVLPLSAVAQSGLILHTLLTRRRPWLRRHLGVYCRGVWDAFAALPQLLRKRRALPRRIGAGAYAMRLLQAEAQRRASRRRVREQRAAAVPVVEREA